jgi:hypothetical protein
MPVNLSGDLLGPSALGLFHQLDGLSRLSLAYLDPGTGSLLIQAAIAAALAVPFLLRTKLRSLLGRIRGCNRNGSDGEQTRQD